MEEKKIVLSIETITDKNVMEAYGETIDRVLGSYEENTQALAEYNLEIKRNKEVIEEINKLAQKGVPLTEEQVEVYKRLTAENMRLANAKAKTLQILKSEEKIALATAGSMEEQSLVLGKLREAWRAMSDEQKKSNQGMLETIQQLDEALKESDAEIGNFQRNVGNYAGGIARALDRLGILPHNVSMWISSFGDLQKSIKQFNVLMGTQAVMAVRGFVASLSMVKRAILATGIGAIVVAIGVILAAVDGLMESINETESKFHYLRIEIERLKTTLSSIDNADNLLVRLSEAAGESTEKIHKLRLEQARFAHQMAEQARDEAYRKYKRVFENEWLWNGESDELKAAKEALAEADEIEKERYNAVKAVLDDMVVYEEKKRTEKRNKEKEDSEKTAKEAKEQKERERKEVEKIEYDIWLSLLSSKDRELEVARAKYEEKKALLVKYGKDTTQLEEAYNREVQGINQKYYDLYLQDFEKWKEKQAKEIKESTDVAKKELNELIDEMMSEDIVIDKVAESRLVRWLGVTDEQLSTIKKSALSAAQDIFNSISQMSQEAIERRLGDELDSIDREAESEKAILEAKLENNLITQKEYEKKLAELDAETEARKEEANKDAFNKKKAWSIGQAIINGALAVTNIWSQWGAQPIVAGILTGIAATANAIEIATIAAQKYARGGELHGPSHAQGGIKGFVGNRHIEAEGGEIIINKRSSAKHRKLLSLINSDNGWGDDFASARAGSGRFFARGGVLGGYDFRTSPLPDTRSGLMKFAQQQTANVENAINAINQRIDNLRVYLPLSDIEQRSNEKRVHISRAVL